MATGGTTSPPSTSAFGSCVASTYRRMSSGVNRPGKGPRRSPRTTPGPATAGEATQLLIAFPYEKMTPSHTRSMSVTPLWRASGGEGRTGRIDGPIGRSFPCLLEDKLGHGAPTHGPVPTGRSSQSDGASDVGAIRYSQELAELGVNLEVPTGERSSVAKSAGREQQVLARRVYGCPLARHRVAITD